MFGPRLVPALLVSMLAARVVTADPPCPIGVPSCCSADADCDDGEACNGSETCDVPTGTCMAGTPAADDTPCNDHDACTQTDTCQGGTCTGTDPVVCAAPSPCHVDGSCDPATGICSNPPAPDDTPCTDDNLCTQTDTCQGGTCMGSNPIVCMAEDQCHLAGTCDPGSGVCSNPGAPDDTPCDDHDACTQTDTCQDGSCTGTNPVVCPLPDQCHLAGTCDPATGTCSNPLAPDGTPCSDGSACTQTDTCQGGTCTGGNPVVCTAQDQCHVAGTCNPATGVCPNPLAPDATPCDDGDGCTVGDRCLAGACNGVPRPCDDGVPCTDDGCAGGACQHRPVDARCDTGECTLARCQPGAPGADSVGCTGEPVGEGDRCTDDGLACTDDVCMAGACVHTPVDGLCATGNVCVPAACDPRAAGADAAGCVALPDRAAGSECVEDGDPCTDDTCAAGGCVHAPVPNKTTCDPVRDAYERTLVLAATAERLSRRIAEAFPAGGTPLTASAADITSTFQGVARILAGKEGGSSAPSPPFVSVAQERARMASLRVRPTPAQLGALLREVSRALQRGMLAVDAGRDLRRQARDLLRGTKALKRELKRLQVVSRSFAR